jgi:exopolyphosphatase/guanosine-5'-triphosphate,3'-diphosphate pyrophosphatase
MLNIPTRVAVIDLGTNTFNLLLAEVHRDRLIEILKKEEPVRLGEGGLTQNYINEAAFKRGLQTLKQFELLIKASNISKVKAVATSAIRNADNGKLFIECIKKETGIEVEIIHGNEEAELIYRGVRCSGLLTANTGLIMDIGGGSVEFIICNQRTLFWKKSFEIGVVRLMHKYHQEDPIPAQQVEAMETELKLLLKELFKAAETYKPLQLIGSAGAFETFRAMRSDDESGDAEHRPNGYRFELQSFFQLAADLEKSSNEEREQTATIIPLRKDMIVSAAMLTRFVLKELNIQLFEMADYSLKEGLAWSLSKR